MFDIEIHSLAGKTGSNKIMSHMILFWGKTNHILLCMENNQNKYTKMLTIIVNLLGFVPSRLLSSAEIEICTALFKTIRLILFFFSVQNCLNFVD